MTEQQAALEADSPTPVSTWQKWFKIALAVAALGALIYFGRQAGDYVITFAEWVRGLGVWGPVVFIAGYVVATVAFIPGSILTMAAGAIFGLAWGTLWVFIASTTGSALAFLIGRYFARGAVERKLEDSPKFKAIDDAVGKKGFRIVLLLRLSPVFPFNLLNYALGLTQVRFWHFVAASIGMIPGTFLYVYYGKAIGSVAQLAAGAEVERGVEQWIFLGVGLVATIVVAILVARYARKELEEATDA